MLLQEEREEIVEYGKRMSGDRLAAGTSGNISIYNAEKGWMAKANPGGLFQATQDNFLTVQKQTS